MKNRLKKIKIKEYSCVNTRKEEEKRITKNKTETVAIINFKKYFHEFYF